ncbi:nitrate reductase molybdenum cofactor assembly chaperone [Cellulomonas palmilytica]|uniref:nitrate reductase molybdenum cofactor assembly chaperone n=1 Tax=Cellulomonas palmilytica TaxID=2608402 RepID=UPI001F2190D7|nr:nitrate reductase molybdenum cofactor assembly chaperone [Cellulomonas palmilytica]UJP40397.1 nitrate reductase molybdenum cofactor assembly chaperone [Cellulomonas palmilytica]
MRLRTRSRSAGPPTGIPDAVPRVVHQASSWCLAYPDEALVERLPLLAAAVDELPAGRARDGLRTFLDHAAATPLAQLQSDYVHLFDLSRKQALYLSYWTDGDTRRRGEVLAGFKERYRASGFLVDTRGELPDHLPLVLEYAALADPDDGAALLQEYRASLELTRFALIEAGTPYAGVLEAVCATLPGPSPADKAAVHRMAAAGPPAESVGLDAADPRLLPLTESGRS